MIPTELEKLVLCQKAFSRSITVGRSGQLVIPVDPDVVPIIWHFDYFNFIDSLEPDNIDVANLRSVHQVQFKSDKSLNSYVIKDDLLMTAVVSPAPPELINHNNVTGYYSKDCYQVHSNNIIISISVAPPIAGTLTALGSPSNKLKAENPPLGYGTTPGVAIAQTINEVYPLAIGDVIPATRKFNVSSIPTPMPTNSLRYPITLATALNPTFTGGPQGQRSYPILNIDYVEIPRQVADELFNN